MFVSPWKLHGFFVHSFRMEWYRVGFSFAVCFGEMKTVPASKIALRRGVGSAAAVAAVATVLLFLPLLDGQLDGLSLDLLFSFRSAVTPPGSVLVALDADAYEDLKEPKRKPIDRRHHARLLDRLASAGAKAVVFDMVFDDALSEEDPLFAVGLGKAKSVIGAEFDRATRLQKERLVPPVPALRSAAGAWGLVNLEVQERWTVRSYRLWEDVGSLPLDLPGGRARSVALCAWELVNPGQTNAPAVPQRIWLNYYAPRENPDDVIRYSDALDPEKIPDKRFRGQVVFVGSQMSIGIAGSGKDEFATPFSLSDRSTAHGVSIHKTAYLNLLNRDWLERPPAWGERTVIVLLAAALAALLVRLPTFRGMLATMLGVVVVIVVAWYGFEKHRLWFAWVKLGLGFVGGYGWAVVYNLYRTHIENVLLRRTIEGHFSGKLVERVLRDPNSLLTREGEKRMAAYLFTDIAESTKIADVTDPLAFVRELNGYFDGAVGEVHAQDGMVAKFLGDGIFAMWNVPYEQSEFRRSALTAAVGLKERIGDYDAVSLGLRFRTRIGLHCGEASVGNCGGKERFEYTAIGAAVNLASRLEGANRILGTQLLASREVVEGLEKEFVLREIGYCKLKGMGRPTRIYEVLGVEGKMRREEWLGVFAEGIGKFRGRDFVGAAVCFQQVLELKPGDGPSGFLLGLSNRYAGEPPPKDWLGEIDLT